MEGNKERMDFWNYCNLVENNTGINVYKQREVKLKCWQLIVDHAHRMFYPEFFKLSTTDDNHTFDIGKLQ